MKTQRTTKQTTSTMTRAVAYLRVSTEDQADTGVSLAAQRAKVEAYAALYDLEIVAIEVDAGVSAKTLDRPALGRALGMLRSGEADALVVVKLDRLTRSVADLGALLNDYFGANGAGLLSVSEQLDCRTAAGRMVMNMLATVAQWERETIGERTAVAMQHKKARGELVGSVPYGYLLAADGVSLDRDEDEQATIARARELAEAGGLSLRKIAAQLEAEGRVSRTGRTFAAAQVQKMVAA